MSRIEISRDDERALLAIAQRAAAVGAELLDRSFLHVRGERLAVEKKASAIDLVTEVDRASEAAILEVLREGPTIDGVAVAIVAEEGSGDPQPIDGAPVWYVDPLDGTTNYAFGHPFHCVSIGLVVDGGPRVGVVHAPALGVVWSGTRALGGTRLDLTRGIERTLAVSEIDAIEDVLLATGFPYDRRTSSDDNLAAHGAMMKRAQGVMRCGSAALDLCLVADGTYGGFWERKLKPWDLAAGASLVLAAGGRCGGVDGGMLRVESGSIVASNGRIHGALLEGLRPHFPTL